MAGSEKVIGALVPSGWTEAIGEFIAGLPSSPLRLSNGEYRRRIEAGELRCLRYDIDCRPAGCLLWRPEFGASGNPEFVVVAAVAPHHRGVSLVDIMMPGIEAWAAQSGFHRVRCHTGRAGLVRRLKDHGYVEAETVLMKVVR
jgi:hypothetical protein